MAHDLRCFFSSAIEMYHDQIKWLSQGNRKVFGVVNGSRVGVLVDTSDLNCCTERLADLQRELLTLIDEQLRFKKQLHLLSYGSEVSSLWDKPQDTCLLRLRECCAWVMQLRAGGGCDLLQALQRALTHSELDTLLIILVLANSCVHAAQKLDLYQLLARNAYSPQEMFVPVLGKTVSSTVHERVMVQFEWHDGTVKNLHVDLPSLQKYQRLMGAVHLFERRVQWLNRTGSQQIWGTVCEQRVQVLLDMSGMNVHYQLHIQHAIRILLQEQLADKHNLSLCVCVFRWIQAVECVGGRNTLAALRCALEEEEQEESSLTRGVYLLTTGMPDQHMVSVTAYVSERCSTSNLNLHVCLFTGEEDTARCPPPRYATRTETARALSGLAHAGNGRFLWMTETGIVESDDISALIGEMETAVNYFQKVSSEQCVPGAFLTCPVCDLCPRCLNNSWEPEEKFETPARSDQLLMFRKVHPGLCVLKMFHCSSELRHHLFSQVQLLLKSQ
uniref:VWFA domain-containing protein n=1 Tax=Cyprinus carpio TaxID=7962 RepID=A0A8C2EGX6_CYPCA